MNRDEVITAQKAQARAMSDLRAWFNDRATTLRTVFDSRECVFLGLTVIRRADTGEDEVVNENRTPNAEVAQPTS